MGSRVLVVGAGIGVGDNMLRGLRAVDQTLS